MKTVWLAWFRNRVGTYDHLVGVFETADLAKQALELQRAPSMSWEPWQQQEDRSWESSSAAGPPAVGQWLCVVCEAPLGDEAVLEEWRQDKWQTKTKYLKDIIAREEEVLVTLRQQLETIDG